MSKNIMTSSGNESAYLGLYVGPMFCGKTTKILDIYKQCKFCNISVYIINHSIDKRYHETMVSSHDKIMAPCLQATNLGDIWNNPDEENYKALRNSDVILINEGQFFPDLYEVVVDMLKNKKKIYVCGLDGDFERKKFGAILDLIPLCDEICKLKSLCSLCKNGTAAIHSMRLTSETEQTVVGSDNYIPTCRNCYETKRKV
jgi:thymidine kinase